MSTSLSPVLQVNVADFGYANARRLALPTFNVRAGEIVVLSGRSGSGKSTLMHLTTGVLALAKSQGDIRVGEHSLAGLDQGARDRLRPYVIGWAPQRVHLISALSVIENILLPITMTSRAPSEVTLKERVASLMNDAEIASIAQSSATNVSVGQAARACVVRALIANPALLCADEPSAALDEKSANAIANLIASYAQSGGAALIASHDASFVAALEQRANSVRTISLEAP
jgi:putative ABC transport system ATP-binding protein